MQGRAISFPEPEPWPEPVDGAALLDEISKAIGAHVIMPEASRDACALWAAHTFLLDCTMISPRLAITSPTRGCGKTTALDVISQLVLRPLPAANVSASAIFRVVEGFRPTLMIDEADSFLRDNEELRGVLNSGHRKGGAVLRNVGDDHEPRSFSTYGACAIALIGQLPRHPHRPISTDHADAPEARRGNHAVPARPGRSPCRPGAQAGALDNRQRGGHRRDRTGDAGRDLQPGRRQLAAVAGHRDGRGRRLAGARQRAALAGVATDIDDAALLELLLGDIRTIFAKPRASTGYRQPPWSRRSPRWMGDRGPSTGEARSRSPRTSSPGC